MRTMPKPFVAVLIAMPLTLAGCTGDDQPTPATTSAASASVVPAVGSSNLPDVIARVEPSVVTVLVGEGLGSGVVFRDGGLVLTNQHVVGDSRTVQLALADGARIDAQVVGTDTVTDLAVLRAARTDLPPVQFRAELPAPGETVLAMGSPLGLMNTVTAGIVSGVGREIPGSASQGRPLVDLIQTDAPISPGNSGGALVDADGRVVGINDAYLPPSTGAVSIGFAIPAATAIDVADDLLDDGKVTHPYLGVAVGQLTPQIAQALGTGTDRGVLVRDVTAGGPAAAAGLRPGDVITGFGGTSVATVEAFLGELRGVDPGDRTELTIVRDGKEQKLPVTFGAAER
jgi:S1-C subfamily serine protease